MDQVSSWGIATFLSSRNCMVPTVTDEHSADDRRHHQQPNSSRHQNVIGYLRGSSGAKERRWRSHSDIVIGAEDLRFDSRTGRIGGSVANGSPVATAAMFFWSCVVQMLSHATESRQLYHASG